MAARQGLLFPYNATEKGNKEDFYLNMVKARRKKLCRALIRVLGKR